MLAYVLVDRDNFDQVSIRALNQENFVIWKFNGPVLVPPMDDVDFEENDLFIFRENMFRLEGIGRFEPNLDEF